jgi:hypothetical protein
MPVQRAVTQGHYRILLSDSAYRPQAMLYAFTLQDAIPDFILPLKPGGPEVTVDLKALLSGIYDRAGYGIRLKYDVSSLAALSPEDKTWIESHLAME